MTEFSKDTPEAKLLALHGLPVDQTTLQQLATFIAALQVFRVRTEIYGDLWARQNPSDSVNHMHGKMERIKLFAQMVQDEERASGAKSPRVEALLDDVLDIINYAAFLRRHLTGAYPDCDPEN